MGQGASTEQDSVTVTNVTAVKPPVAAEEGDFGVRYGGEGLESIVAAGAAEGKEALQAKMQQAYEAGMRDSSSDNAAGLAQYKLSIIGDFQRELEAMQSTHAATASSLAAGVQKALEQGPAAAAAAAKDACPAEEKSVTDCYLAHRTDPLACAAVVAAYQQCANQS